MAKYLLTAMMFLMCTVSPAAKPVTVSIGAGGTIPSGEIEHEYKAGFHILGAVGVKSSPIIDYMGKIEYNSLRPNQIYLDGNLWGIMYGGAARLTATLLTRWGKPFVLGGMGLFTGKTGDVVAGSNPSESEVGAHFYGEFAIGLEGGGYRLHSLMMFRVLYVTMDGGITVFPITIGFRF